MDQTNSTVIIMQFIVATRTRINSMISEYDGFREEYCEEISDIRDALFSFRTGMRDSDSDNFPIFVFAELRQINRDLDRYETELTSDRWN